MDTFYLLIDIINKYINIRNLNNFNEVFSNKINKILYKKSKKKNLKNLPVSSFNEKFFQKSNKLHFCSPYFWKKIFLFQQNRVFKFCEKRIYSRSSIIPFGFLRQYVLIHSGKKWYGRVVNKWNVGFKFGELTWNRRIAMYKAKQLKKKKKK